MSLPPGTMVHVTASRPMSEAIRLALIELVEVAYAAAEKGILHDESYPQPKPQNQMDVSHISNRFTEPEARLFSGYEPKKRLPRKLKKRLKKEAGRSSRPMRLPDGYGPYRPFSGRFA